MSANVPDRRGGHGVASLLRTAFFFFVTPFLSFFRFFFSSYLISVLSFPKSLLLFSSPLHCNLVQPSSLCNNCIRFLPSVDSFPFVNCFPMCQTVLLV